MVAAGRPVHALIRERDNGIGTIVAWGYDPVDIEITGYHASVFSAREFASRMRAQMRLAGDNAGPSA